LSIKIQDAVVKNHFMNTIREIVAIILWSFIFIKVIIIDIDVYFFEKYLPSLRWILNYRFFALLMLIALVLFGISKKSFRKFFVFVISYPIILLWRIVKLSVRNWALIIVFAPAIYNLVKSFRSKFILMTIAILSIICIILSSNIYLLITSMALLGMYLINHLYFNLRKAYRSSIFEQLSDLVKNFGNSLECGKHVLWKKEKYASGTKEYEQQHLTFYLLWSCAEIVRDKLIKVAKSRKPDLYLIFSWFITVLLTSLIYAFEYWSLYKVDIHSFSSPVNRTLSFWSFLGFSFGKLTPSSISSISPMNFVATILTYSELLCTLIILGILFFSILTAAREKYKEDIDEFISEVGNLGVNIYKQFCQLYEVALADVEIILISNNANLINYIRKARGLPNLSVPEKNENKVEKL
jgi:hypothetical protein